MTWKNSLRIGIPEIDRQHRELCEAIDRLYDACSQGQGADEVLKTLDFLESYTVRHFSEEEALQQKIRYPKYLQHKRLHADFIARIAQMKSEMLVSGVTVPMVIQINRMISDWLINHIMRVDAELKNYIA